MPTSAGSDFQPATGPVWEAALIGSSPEIIGLTKTIWRLAQEQADILILGDAGTGKSLAASLIHRWGPRKLKTFAAFESAAFTTASFLNQTAGGIVLLNEIGYLPEQQQANLLELLETKNAARPASGETQQLDVQILAATSQNLEAEVESGKFRRDLYARLQGNVLRLPRLREYVQDIPALVWYFIQKFNAFYGRNIVRVAPEVFPALQSEPWEGNVRELKNRVEAAVLKSAGQLLQLQDFSGPAGQEMAFLRPGAGLNQPYRQAKGKLLQEFHQAYLGFHLGQHQWNRSRTARAIGIMREQLNALIRRYKLTRPK